MASEKCILIGLLIFFTAFTLIGICIIAGLLVLANPDPNQTGSANATSEKTTMATLKSSIQVTSTFDNMKSSTTSLTTQANPNATSVELLTKSDISTIKPNDTKGTIDMKLSTTSFTTQANPNATSVELLTKTTTIWDTQSTDITTTAIFLIKQNTTKNPISTTISSKSIETGIIYTALDCMYIVCIFINKNTADYKAGRLKGFFTSASQSVKL